MRPLISDVKRTLISNVNEAIEVWARSCQGGSADECVSLADTIAEGKEGAPKNTDVATKLYVAACRLEVDYCEHTGDMVVKLGGPAEVAAAAYAKDCDKYKDSEACGRLGQMYRAGKGVPRDPAKGTQLLTAACDNGEGYDWACAELSG